MIYLCEMEVLIEKEMKRNYKITAIMENQINKFRKENITIINENELIIRGRGNSAIEAITDVNGFLKEYIFYKLISDKEKEIEELEKFLQEIRNEEKENS